MQSAYCGQPSPEHLSLVYLANLSSSHFPSHMIHHVHVNWLLLSSLEHIKLFSAKNCSSVLPWTSLPLPLFRRNSSQSFQSVPDVTSRQIILNHSSWVMSPSMLYSVIHYHLNCLYSMLTKKS